MTGIPLAVSPSVKTPGLYLTVNLLSGAASPGSGALRVVLMCPKASSGDLVEDTEVRTLSGDDGAGTAWGIGSPGHLAAKEVFRKYPTALVDAVAPTAGSGTAALTLTFAGALGANNVLDVDIHGVTFEVSWLLGEDVDDIRDKLIDAINERTTDLACSAASGGAGVVTVSSKVLGNIGNDIRVYIKLREGTTGSETINTGTVVDTKLSGGTTDPDFTTAYGLLSGREYHYIGPCVSNADAANTATANTFQKGVLHIANYNTGKDAKLQQLIGGNTPDALSTSLATTPHANSLDNEGFCQLVTCLKGRSLPCVFMARMLGGRLAAVSLDPAANLIGEIFDGVAGARDVNADKPTDPEVEQACNGGVSIISYTPQDSEVSVRPITCHSQDSAGGQDSRLLDTQNVDGTYIVARDIRDQFPIEFAGAKLSRDLTVTDDPPPAGVIEERDAKAWVIGRLRSWVPKGVVQSAHLEEVIADGSLIVQVNDTDETQLDMFLPYKIVQPLAKTGVTAARIAS